MNFFLWLLSIIIVVFFSRCWFFRCCSRWLICVLILCMVFR